MAQKHEFAFFIQNLSKHSKAYELTIDDSQLVNRLVHVVRLAVGEHCIVFDHAVHAQSVIKEIHKKYVKVELLAITPHVPLQPAVDFLLPILKREDFELALYAMVELGASRVQLVHTDKGQRSWGGAKDMERAQRIMIAAAEQSKNYALPVIHEPISLQQAIAAYKPEASKIFFDPAGSLVLDVISSVKAQNSQSLVLLVGPEGDLTDQEKQQLKKHQFIFCALTPTVLRSFQAVQVGLGIFRSVLK